MPTFTLSYATVCVHTWPKYAWHWTTLECVHDLTVECMLRGPLPFWMLAGFMFGSKFDVKSPLGNNGHCHVWLGAVCWRHNSFYHSHTLDFPYTSECSTIWCAVSCVCIGALQCCVLHVCFLSLIHVPVFLYSVGTSSFLCSWDSLSMQVVWILCVNHLLWCVRWCSPLPMMKLMDFHRNGFPE